MPPRKKTAVAKKRASAAGKSAASVSPAVVPATAETAKPTEQEIAVPVPAKAELPKQEIVAPVPAVEDVIALKEEVLTEEESMEKKVEGEEKSTKVHDEKAMEAEDGEEEKEEEPMEEEVVGNNGGEMMTGEEEPMEEMEEKGTDMDEQEEDPVEEEQEEEQEDPIEEEQEDEEGGEGDGEGGERKDEREESHEKAGKEERDGIIEKKIDAEKEDNSREDEAGPTMHHVPETRMKEIEIYIGGLHKDATEEDIVNVFGQFGEIKSVKIVRHPLTGKSKGFAFMRYADLNAAQMALSRFKDGTEVKGRRVRISASQDNNTLCIGNICKTWTKDQVLDTMKGLGVGGIEQVVLQEDPNADTEGDKSKGFAFIEFGTHSNAMAAFQRLRKPDAVFGLDLSAKVSFAPAPGNPADEMLLKVKTVYLESVPISWSEDKIKEICQGYGQIERIQLYRKSKSTKKKNFAFVEFASRESAMECIEGINTAQIGEVTIKLKASLARPISKGGRLTKQGTHGGFKVNTTNNNTNNTTANNKNITTNNKNNNTDSRDTKNKHAHVKNSDFTPGSKKRKPESKEKSGRKNEGPSKPAPQGDATSNTKERLNGSKKFKGNNSNKPLKGVTGYKGSNSKLPFNNNNNKGKKRSWKGEKNKFTEERFTKKSRKNRDNGRKPSRSSYGYLPPYSTGPHPYSYAGTSRSYRPDLEPHAGCLPAPSTAAYYEQRSSVPYSYQRSAAYAPVPSVPQASHPAYAPSYHEAPGYSYPPNGSYPANYAPRRAYY